MLENFSLKILLSFGSYDRPRAPSTRLRFVNFVETSLAVFLRITVLKAFWESVLLSESISLVNKAYKR